MSFSADPELNRYKEYLQRSILDDRWHSFVERSWERFDPLLLRAEAERAGIDSSTVLEWQRAFEAVQPATPFDQPDLISIFQPIWRRLETAAVKLGMGLRFPVELVSSTDLSPTPLARPSNGSHLLFVGIGTGKFCNCWAKAVTSIAAAAWTTEGLPKFVGEDELFALIQSNWKSASLAFHLLVCFGLMGTVAAADDNEPEDDWKRSHRATLLDAMEIFALGHEFSHFIAHERAELGNLSPLESLALEYACDDSGFRLSREASLSPANCLTFCGVGAIVLFRSLDMSDRARQICISKGVSCVPTEPLPAGGRELTHPPLVDRINAMKKTVAATTPDKHLDATMTVLERYDRLMVSASNVLLTALRNASPEKRPKRGHVLWFVVASADGARAREETIHFHSSGDRDRSPR